MKVAVLGAGVIGVTTAYYLAKAGHQVTVLDRQSGPALETSFANAGEISPGYASPWAAPGVPFKAIKWLFERHAPLVIGPTIDSKTWKWVASMMLNCTASRYAINKGRMVRLAEYSRDCLIALREETAISYDHRTQGTLQLFRDPRELDSMRKDIEVLRADGVHFEVLDPAGCVVAEPGLAPVREKIAGGLRLPNDETGDCFMFTNELSKQCQTLGVEFRFGVNIRRLRIADDRVTSVETDLEEVDADTFVAALGSYTPSLVAPLGLKLPVYPIKGYSITLPIVDESRAPVSTVMDETYKVAITRLGSRIRVGGMAEIAGFNLDLPLARRETLEHSVEDLFGGAGDQKRANFWTGLRPMTPDGTPVVGNTRFSNLYLNSGHGTLRWTMACGSGRIVADLISGAKPEIEASDFSLDRYR